MEPDQGDRMSYFKSTKEADQLVAYFTDINLCFECGGRIDKGVVRYDGHSDSNTLKGIFFHPACAVLMGQRLISDGFPNRHSN